MDFLCAYLAAEGKRQQVQGMNSQSVTGLTPLFIFLLITAEARCVCELTHVYD